MKKILGLDLGSTSIGWAFIEEKEKSSKILGMGVRIVPYSGNENDDFTKGKAISTNKERTLKRTARKTIHRYKQRRKKLLYLLDRYGMMPDEKLLRFQPALSLYEIRAKAVNEKITLPELGRILYHLNQKRGYKSSRINKNEEEGKNLSQYLSEIKERKELIDSSNLTIGEYFYNKLKSDATFRIKEIVFPRECYINEFEKIWNQQQKHYPYLLSDELRKEIGAETIFFQRRLKSQKHLVGKCMFEAFHRVAPKSSPLFQVERYGRA